MTTISRMDRRVQPGVDIIDTDQFDVAPIGTTIRLTSSNGALNGLLRRKINGTEWEVLDRTAAAPGLQTCSRLGVKDGPGDNIYWTFDSVPAVVAVGARILTDEQLGACPAGTIIHFTGDTADRVRTEDGGWRSITDGDDVWDIDTPSKYMELGNEHWWEVSFTPDVPPGEPEVQAEAPISLFITGMAVDEALAHRLPEDTAIEGEGAFDRWVKHGPAWHATTDDDNHDEDIPFHTFNYEGYTVFELPVAVGMDANPGLAERCPEGTIIHGGAEDLWVKQGTEWHICEADGIAIGSGLRLNQFSYQGYTVYRVGAPPAQETAPLTVGDTITEEWMRDCPAGSRLRMDDHPASPSAWWTKQQDGTWRIGTDSTADAGGSTSASFGPLGDWRIAPPLPGPEAEESVAEVLFEGLDVGDAFLLGSGLVYVKLNSTEYTNCIGSMLTAISDMSVRPAAAPQWRDLALEVQRQRQEAATAEQRFTALAAAHQEWKDKLVQDAHEYANRNDLCEKFDQFMGEHDLPPRERAYYVRVEYRIVIRQTVNAANADDAERAAVDAIDLQEDSTYRIHGEDAEVTELIDTYVELSDD